MNIQPHDNPVMEKLAKHIEFNQSELTPIEIIHKIQVATKVSYKRAVSAYQMLQERLSYLIPSECIEQQSKLLRSPYLALFEKLDLEIASTKITKRQWSENIRFWTKVLSTPGWDGKKL
jgi:hypothetical protein